MALYVCAGLVDWVANTEAASFSLRNFLFISFLQCSESNLAFWSSNVKKNMIPSMKPSSYYLLEAIR